MTFFGRRFSRCFGQRVACWLAEILFVIICVAIGGQTAHAQTCTQEAVYCVSDSGCPTETGSGLARTCISGNCQYRCDDALGNPTPNLCMLGETCTAGVSVGGLDVNYCRSSTFAMDLNLLDSCIYHFVKGIDPPLLGSAGNNSCTVSNALSQMLHRDSDSDFDIYDVDLCVKDFLKEKPCDLATKTCANDQTFCETDNACGDGLFCNALMHRCERECGFIVSRNTSKVYSLERYCSGDGQVCNYERGKCVQADLSESTCQLDSDCPVGTYCFVGECRPKCYRSLDCPDDTWMCNGQNECVPKPKSLSGVTVNPKDYAIQFSDKNVNIDGINNIARIPLVIMDVRTKKQIFNNSNVVFGYRLETSYGRKLSPECLGDNVSVDGCVVAKDREFLTLSNPFGTISGDKVNTIDVSLNATAAAKLPVGFYEVVLRVIFNNGSQTTTTVRYQRPSLSGAYTGTVEVHVGGSVNVLADSNLDLQLRVKPSTITWKKLLTDNNLAENDEFEDLTVGNEVEGYIDGNGSTIFTNPASRDPAQNRVYIKGIYSVRLARMRLIAVIEHGANDCISESGACGTVGEFSVTNPFRRKIRRLVEFIGPYDATTRVFSGVYRETFSGLTPSDITFDGKFRIYQSAQAEDTIAVPVKLLAVAGALGFPNEDSILIEANNDVNKYCASSSASADAIAMKSRFSTKDSFGQMLASYEVNPPALAKNLVHFEGSLAEAVGRLPASSKAALTVAEFLKGQAGFCPTDFGQCVNRPDAECGLALFKKAILQRWAVVDATNTTNRPPLFCTRGNVSNSAACVSSTELPAYAALQEHNRFYRELVQTWVYTASGNWSDAFYALYKAANGDAMYQSNAFAVKSNYMKAAITAYDNALSASLSNSATAILFQWPVASFQTNGQAWLDQLYNLSNNRLEAVIELLGFRRRVLKDGEDRVTYAHHVVQYEYLQQAFLAILQQHWQGSQFTYRGEGRDSLLRGQKLLQVSDLSRNPLGLHPNRVYFQNNELSLKNWKFHLDRVDKLLNGDPVYQKVGLRETVSTANEQMKNALKSTEALAAQILQNKLTLEAELDERCGASSAVTTACTKVDFTKIEKEWTCDGRECESVIEKVRAASSLDDVACRKDVPYTEIALAGGAVRRCMGGRIGALQQERATLEVQRRVAYDRIGLLVTQIEREKKFMTETLAGNSEFLEYIEKRNKLVNSAEDAIRSATATFEYNEIAAEPIDCLTIIGTSDGTTCPQAVAKAFVRMASAQEKNNAVDGYKEALGQLEAESALEVQLKSMGDEERLLRKKMDDLVTEVGNHVSELRLINQNLGNVTYRIGDELFLAQSAAKRINEQLGSIVSQLTGEESGSVLLRNRLVKTVDAKYDATLVELYKLVQAFSHRFNNPTWNAALTNMVYSAVTIQDIDTVLETIASYVNTYYSGDADQENNVATEHFSLQELLFPNLHDVIDPQTGAVLTKGEQFHQLITSSEFTRRRKFQLDTTSYIATEIALPFALWLNGRSPNGGATVQFLISPNECNHILTYDSTKSPGTVAVQFVGRGLNHNGEVDSVKYRLERGDTDYLRACNGGAVNIFNIGVANDSAVGSMSKPPTFYSVSTDEKGCTVSSPVNVQDCWKLFARDRSLAAPDWKLIIPLYYNEDLASEQGWLLGLDKVPEEKPIIQDILLYFRYHRAPVPK